MSPDFAARLVRYLESEVGIDKHTHPDVRRAFFWSVGRIALRHFRDLDAVDPHFVVWNGERIAIGGAEDPEYRKATKDRLRAFQRARYYVRRFGDQIRHIVDWLEVAVRNDHAWLEKVDDKGRPKKLMKCGSIEQLHQEAEKQFRISRSNSPAASTPKAP